VGFLRATYPADLADEPFTYPEIGGTTAGPLPHGYRHATRRVTVGHGRGTFERTAAAVLDWRAQQALGLRIRATGPASRLGTVVVLTAGRPRFGYDLPCRVVWGAAAGEERGFAYGTLPGHPQCGEERFAVRLALSGAVVFEIRSFFRLASPLARLGGPVSLLMQREATDRYVSAICLAARR
jgi:uncharacterized protein (UPF0548 family)